MTLYAKTFLITASFFFQSGPLLYPKEDPEYFGLNKLQIVAIAFGSVVTCVTLLAVVMFLCKRYIPVCAHCGLSSPEDTHILIIEGPEDCDCNHEESTEDEEEQELESA
jgi:hypothetical protein